MEFSLLSSMLVRFKAKFKRKNCYSQRSQTENIDHIRTFSEYIFLEASPWIKILQLYSHYSVEYIITLTLRK